MLIKNYKKIFDEMSVKETQEQVVELYFKHESLSLPNVIRKITKKLNLSKNEVLHILDQSGVLQ